MPRSHRTRALVGRTLAGTLTVAALALYGLAAGGGPAPAFRTTAAPTIGANSAQSVSLATSPTNNSVNVAVRGPNNSLRFYWEVGGTWYGPLGLGAAGTTFSAPSIIAEANGNFDIAVQGPGNTTFFYWDASGTWYGPLQVAAPGTTFSTPSLTLDGSAHLNLGVQGPSNGLHTYWNVAGTWYGPLGIGGTNSTFSAPNLSYHPSGSIGAIQAFATGPNSDLREWERGTNGMWSGPREWTNDQRAFSTVSSYDGVAVFQGPNHSLTDASGFVQSIQIGTSGTVYSAPSFVSGAVVTDNRITAQGPSHSLYYWFENNQGWNGPVQIGMPGTTFSAPSMEDENSGSNLDLAVQGPNNSLYFYWSIGGIWNGPVQIAGAGTTFSSPN